MNPQLAKHPRQKKVPGQGKGKRQSHLADFFFRLGDLKAALLCKPWCLLRAVSGDKRGKMALRNGRNKRFWPGRWSEGEGLAMGLPGTGWDGDLLGDALLIPGSGGPGLRGDACPTFFLKK